MYFKNNKNNLIGNSVILLHYKTLYNLNYYNLYIQLFFISVYYFKMTIKKIIKPNKNTLLLN